MSIFRLTGNRKWLYHVIGWALYICCEVPPAAIARHAMGEDDPVWLYVVSYSFNILLFYTHARVVLRYCFASRKKRPLLFAGLVLAELAGYMLLMSIIQGRVEGQPPWLGYASQVAFVRQLWRGFYF